MECGRMREQLGFYIDAALGERDMGEVAEHLARCAECRAELAALTTMIEAARGIEEVEPPEDLRAAIAAATTQRHKTSVLYRLRAAFAPNGLRWAAGFAGAAVLLLAVVMSSRPPQPSTPSVTRTQSPVRTQAQVAPSQPSPVTAALTPAPSASASDAASIAPKRHSRTVRARAIAKRGPSSSPTAKSAAKPTIANSSPAAGESDAEVYGVDDTTAASTVTPADIREPERVAMNESPKLEHISVKVASMPLPKEEQVAEWVKDAKTAAAMHRRGNPVGVSLINARF
jgi:hypothetical protein